MSQDKDSKNKIFSTATQSDNQNSPNRKLLKWSQEEDNKLLELVEIYGNRNWKKISEHMETRNPVQCLHRWTKILKPGLVKGPWTAEEDKKLVQWVKKQGAMKWSMCSEMIPGRSGKQCRERWYNNLSPDVVKGNWSAKEDYLIFKLFSTQGSKWSKIAESFKGRTENSIKNRFYSTLRRIASKYNNSHQSGNLDELLEYFPIALKEKEDEYNKESEASTVNSTINETTSKEKDAKMMSLEIKERLLDQQREMLNLQQQYLMMNINYFQNYFIALHAINQEYLKCLFFYFDAIKSELSHKQ